MTEVHALPDKTLTPFDGALVTIRSKKSYADVTAAIEAKLQRFSIAKFMEYVVHQDKEGLEAYVARVSAPSKFSIFWDFDQGSSFRLAGIPIESKFYLVGNAVIARGLFPAHQDWEHRLGSACPSATVRKPASTWICPRPFSANFRKHASLMFPRCWTPKW